MNEWDRAYTRLISEGDLRPLANLVKGGSPIPPRIREHLGRMLDPDTDPRTADRLVFSRTPAAARAMQTQQDKIVVGLAVLDAVAAGTNRKRAVTAAMKKYCKSQSYVEHCIDLARRIPSALRDFGRSNPPVYGAARK